MKLVILDRDGVINHDSDQYIKSAKEWKPIDGSLEAIARLTHAGYRVVVTTNQAGIGRGLFDYEALSGIHNKMMAAVEEKGGKLDEIFFCPHKPDDNCNCRKPKPGMLEQVARRFQIELNGIPMVGDSLKDLQAAQAAGARPVLVRTGNGTKTEAGLPKTLLETIIYDNLSDAVTAFINNND